MADAASKVTVFFESTGGTASTGWTETFYSSEGDLPTAADVCVKKYIPKRVEMLGVQAFCRGVRVTKIPSNRLSYVQFITGEKDQTGGIWAAETDGQHDPTQVDLLCRAQTADGHRRSLWIAGLPDTVCNQLKAQGVTAGFLNGAIFKQWMGAIRSIPYGIRWKSGAGPVYTLSPIVEILPVMVRNRKRGRPFFLFRGRRAV